MTKLDIRVIFGNPPYSIGQGSQNDNNQNVEYPHLDKRIAETYAARSIATLSRGLYDSYIRAIRWASDRIGNAGVIGFVTNAGWLDANTADGLRQCLAEEFSSIHVFHLRGNQRTSGEQSRKEGGKIFGSGSRAPIAISLLVKNPNGHPHGRIHFHDIGDYLSRDDKLEKIAAFGSIAGISTDNAWQAIAPDAHGDWLRQRDNNFSKLIVLGDKKGCGPMLFGNYSNGVVTARDAWCYNANKNAVINNMTRMIGFYNSEVARFNNAHPELDRKARETQVLGFINTDPTQISWTVNLKQELVRGRSFQFESESLTPSLYRPFTKQWFYFNRVFNERVLQMPRIFPNVATENRVICLTGLGESAGFSVLMSAQIPNFHFIAGSQCFPLYLYDPVVPAQAGTQTTLDFIEEKPLDSRLRGNDDERRGNDDERCGNDDERLGNDKRHENDGDGFRNDGAGHGNGDKELRNDGNERKNGGYVRRDAITDAGLAHFQQAYPHETIGKEDIFYYVYGLLHSKDYRSRYADNLSKELPRMPCVKTAADFWAFSKAGRALAELHLNYETVPMYPSATVLSADGKAINLGDSRLLDSRLRGNDESMCRSSEQESFWRVEKMKVPKTDGQKDLTRLIYNAHISVSGIPPEAYDYVVNGKAALDWVIERQCVKTDKDSGIVNDANDWAIETMGNPRYPLELFLRVVTVSLETMKIVNNLPALEIASD
ncbi:type ISP restriction/modification enzyme [Nitrosomonas sp.]|uniref:type ISP restriction/modification enzyme n=1 Tax=Nitrosomonas sp. TaxID=42353 RepID=UPI0025D20E8B|nr:type ISP restriction/modification enzyme [Nitrosomonas sp.]